MLLTTPSNPFHVIWNLQFLNRVSLALIMYCLFLSSASAWTCTAPTNVALAANGAVATASSAYDPAVCGSGAVAASDGDRTGRARCNNRVWNDAAPANTFPDWLQIDFNGSKTITEIDVITVQDHLEWPVEPTEAMTFSQYGLTAYQVQYWNNATWVTIPGGSVSGNNKVWRKFTFSAITTTKIRVLASASPDGYSRIVELEAWTGPSPAPRYDLALGATATASTSYPGWGPSAVVNGDRKSLNAYSNGAWSSSAANNFPEWVVVDFGANKTINEIHVFTLQDNWAGSTEPTPAMTFTLYGLSGYEVQYWTGSSWVTVPGGSVTGNNKIWRTFTFSPISTSKIRVLTNAAPDGVSRITEIEAYGPAETGGSSNGVRWLIADHLGTPRIIVDQTGSLAGIRRHDYLPFGEELFTGTGGRTVAMGYAADGVRQQFTAKERDIETGLDYFLARYYSSTLGRFTSIDTANADLHNPQTFNKYRYGLNNPLRYIDPDGRQEKEAWYKPILDYFRITSPKPEFNDPEERKPEKTPEYSPIIGSKESLIRKHFAGLVIGSSVVGDTISTLDPIGSTAVISSFMKGDTRGAVVAGVFALPNLFGVPKSALYSGEFLTAKVGNVQIGAQFSRGADNTLNADILGLYGRGEGLSSTSRKLFASIMGFAKEEGFDQVTISGVAFTNAELREKLIKAGWTVTEIKVGKETVSGVSKTFPVR